MRFAVGVALSGAAARVLGMDRYALPEMRAAAPYLVPMHIASYALQLLHGFEARPARRATA